MWICWRFSTNWPRRANIKLKIAIQQGDCLTLMRALSDKDVDLIYLDPPFFTGQRQSSSNRKRTRRFSFDDRWLSTSQYAEFMYERLIEMHRLLKTTGSVFFHCDKNASHIIRLLLDEIFGAENFRSEIIWYFRRWSNAANRLLPMHQNILWYSKTAEYKFHKKFTEYSVATNVDQILQKRSRDEANKSTYARDNFGSVIPSGAKRGVPLGDVWEIPFLNPKAKERVGYPTQKPVLLLRRIISIASDEGDLVLDPFCGSGTALVAAQGLKRRGIGMDTSSDAVNISRNRLKNPVITESRLLKEGKAAYDNKNENVLKYLHNVPHVPVHRNAGIDALLNIGRAATPIPIRIQRPEETLVDAANALYNTAKKKKVGRMILIATGKHSPLVHETLPIGVEVINSISLEVSKTLELMKRMEKQEDEPAEDDRSVILPDKSKYVVRSMPNRRTSQHIGNKTQKLI